MRDVTGDERQRLGSQGLAAQRVAAARQSDFYHGLLGIHPLGFLPQKEKSPTLHILCRAPVPKPARPFFPTRIVRSVGCWRFSKPFSKL
jgi:hypothetical protein